ncbi:hypothetical protein Tco_0852200, partial [Tanacetum coccineum]
EFHLEQLLYNKVWVDDYSDNIVVVVADNKDTVAVADVD